MHLTFTLSMASMAAALAAGVPANSTAQSIRAEVVAGKLEHPWGLAFIESGRTLVTEKPGRMRMVGPTARWVIRLRACLTSMPAARAACSTC